MYTPQFRFVLLVSLFVIFGTIAQVLYSYSFGQHGLIFSTYFKGVLAVGASTLGGFFFIWLCSKFITFNGLKATGFEGVFRDEYGTNFVFKYPIQLTKFLPDLIARPINNNISPLESDMIAFLSGFKNMPFDLNDPKGPSLYEYAIGSWHESRKIKNTNSMHHVTAMAKHIGLTYVYKSKRKSAPLWQFWVRDKVKYSKRCLFHGGYSSFVLSTMPTFHELNDDVKKALLIAVRFADKPGSIPENCAPMIYSLYENSHKAEQRFRKTLNKGKKLNINPSEAAIMELTIQVRDYLQTSLKELNLTPEAPTNQTDGVYLGMGSAIVRVPCLLRTIAKNISPDIRTEFDLWDVTAEKHPAWNHLIDILDKENIISYKLEDQPISSKINTFIVGENAITSAVLLKVEKKDFSSLRDQLDKLPEFTSYALVEKSEEDIIKEVSLKSSKIDDFIKSLYA